MKTNLALTAALIISASAFAFRAYYAPIDAQLEAIHASQQACADIIARSAQADANTDIVSL